MKAKNKMLLATAFVGLFLAVTGSLSDTWSYEVVDHRVYAELLKKYVKNGKVNYQGFKNDETQLDQYLKILEETDTNR